MGIVSGEILTVIPDICGADVGMLFSTKHDVILVRVEKPCRCSFSMTIGHSAPNISAPPTFGQTAVVVSFIVPPQRGGMTSEAVFVVTEEQAAGQTLFI